MCFLLPGQHCYETIGLARHSILSILELSTIVHEQVQHQHVTCQFMLQSPVAVSIPNNAEKHTLFGIPKAGALESLSMRFEQHTPYCGSLQLAMSLRLQRYSSVRCRTGDRCCLKRPSCSSTCVLRQRQHCNASSRLYSQARERSRTSWLPICRDENTQGTSLIEKATERTSGEDEKVLHTITEYFENAKQLHANGVGAATTRQLQLFHQAEQQIWRARDLLKSHKFPVKSPYQELLQVSYRSSLQDLKTSRRFQEAVLVMLGNYGAAFLSIAGYCCSVCAAVMVTLGLALASVQKLPDFVWRLPLWTFVSCLQFLLVAPHVATVVMGALEGECDRVDAAFPGLDQDESAQSVVVFREAMQLIASSEQQVQEAQQQRLYAAQARKIEVEIHKFAEQLSKHIEQN